MTDLRKTIEGMKSAAEKATHPLPPAVLISDPMNQQYIVGLDHKYEFSLSGGLEAKRHRDHINASNPQAVIALATFALEAIKALKFYAEFKNNPFNRTALGVLVKHGLAERGEGEL